MDTPNIITNHMIESGILSIVTSVVVLGIGLMFKRPYQGGQTSNIIFTVALSVSGIFLLFGIFLLIGQTEMGL